MNGAFCFVYLIFIFFSWGVEGGGCQNEAEMSKMGRIEFLPGNRGINHCINIEIRKRIA